MKALGEAMNIPKDVLSIVDRFIHRDILRKVHYEITVSIDNTRVYNGCVYIVVSDVIQRWVGLSAIKLCDREFDQVSGKWVSDRCTFVDIIRNWKHSYQFPYLPKNY